MRTPMQELLEWVRATLPMDLDTPQMIERKIESMLEKEKEMMRLADKNGADRKQYRHDVEYGGAEYWDSEPKPFDEYYNETFNAKEQ